MKKKKHDATAQASDATDVAVLDVVDYLRISGEFGAALTAVLERRFAARQARALGIKVKRDDLQKEADRFRASRDLHKARETHRWLKVNGVSMETFENYLRTSVLIRKLKRRLARRAPKTVLESKRVRESIEESVYRDWLRQQVRRSDHARARHDDNPLAADDPLDTARYTV